MSKIRRIQFRYYVKLYPATTGLSFLIGLGFIGSLIWVSRDVLGFSGLESLGRPWSMLTYPFAFTSPSGFVFLSALFAIVMLWFVGRTLESRWSSIGWACFFFLATLAASTWSLVVSFLGVGRVVLNEPWIVLNGAIMLWALEEPELPLLAYGLFPIKAIYLAWIFVAFGFFQMLSLGLPMACTTLVPVGVAWLWLGSARRRKGRRANCKRETKNRSYLKRIK